MALTYFGQQDGKGLILGLSSDTKPTTPTAGLLFLEMDTEKWFNVVAGAWTLIVSTVYAQRGNNFSDVTSMSSARSNLGLGNVNNTADSTKPISILTQAALDLKAPLASPTFSGTVTGITASMVGLSNVTNESKSTMFTNATFTGTFAVAAGSIGNAALANSAITNLSGTNSGDNAVNSLYSGLVSNATHTGDATGSTALTVVKINGTSLAALATGILKNTTGTGVPSIAIAVDFPTLNQSTTGSAATLTTPRAINGTNFDGSTAITITAAANTLTGTTLASGVTASSLTSLGILASLVIGAGTSAVTPLKLTSGTLNTSPVAGGYEYDGAANYITNDTTSGRGLILVEQKFRLTAAGATISTIANFFGTTSNISLVSGAEYEIEIECWYLKTTAGTVTWTFTNSAAPTSMSLHYELSPITGIVTTAAASTLVGDQYNITVVAPTVVTGSLTTAVNHRAFFKIRLLNSTGTSLKVQATASAGTITPGINSNWKVRRVPAANTGAFAS